MFFSFCFEIASFNMAIPASMSTFAQISEKETKSAPVDYSTIRGKVILCDAIIRNFRQLNLICFFVSLQNCFVCFCLSYFVCLLFFLLCICLLFKLKMFILFFIFQNKWLFFCLHFFVFVISCICLLLKMWMFISFMILQNRNACLHFVCYFFVFKWN